MMKRPNHLAEKIFCWTICKRFPFRLVQSFGFENTAFFLSILHLFHSHYAVDISYGSCGNVFAAVAVFCLPTPQVVFNALQSQT